MKISISIPEELYNDIVDFAEKEERSFSNMISVFARMGKEKFEKEKLKRAS